jgi:cobalamin biosynthesis protein CobT
MADNGIVTLPAIDRTKNLSIREAKVARGYVDHESAHQRWTDLEGNWMEKAHEKSKLLAHLLNGCEDIRIEKLQTDMYPGSKANISETVKATLSKGVKYMEDGEIDIEDKRELVPLGITIAGRETMNYDLDHDDVNKLKDIIGSKLWGLCERAAEESKLCNNTEEVYELAQRIFNGEEMKDEDGNPPPEDGPSKADEGEGEGDQEALAQILSGDMSEAVEDSLIHNDPDDWDRSCETPYKSNWDYDEFIDKNYSGNSRAGRNMLEGSHGKYNHYKDQIIPEIGKVKTSFERYLMSKINRGWMGGLPEGMLDPRRLAGAVTGAENIFRRRDERKEIDTCVSIIVDLSGSMDGSKKFLATKACIALSESLTKLGIPFEITGHGTSGNVLKDGYRTYRSLEAYKKAPLDEGYKRIGILKDEVVKDYIRKWGEFHGYTDDVQDYKIIFQTRLTKQNFHVFKDFNSSLFESEKFIGAIPECISGSNTDGDALLKTYERTIKRPEKKKVIIVLSDGQPYGDSLSSEDAFLKKVAKEVESKPEIFLLHIGIESDCGPEYYTNNLTVNDVSDLPKELMQKAKEIIG